MQVKKGIVCLLLTTLAVLLVSTAGAFAAGKTAAKPVKPILPVKKIAFLPILQVEDEREHGISQILANEMIDFATAKNATFVPDDVLTAALKANNYPAEDNGQKIDAASIKRIQQATGADIAIAVRVVHLRQVPVDGNSSVAFSKATVQMQLIAASASLPAAWNKMIDTEKVLDYSLDGELGPERVATQELRVFLDNAWRKL